MPPVLQWGCGQDAAICLVTDPALARAGLAQEVPRPCTAASSYFPWCLQVQVHFLLNRGLRTGALEAAGLALCLPSVAWSRIQ